MYKLGRILNILLGYHCDMIASCCAMVLVLLKCYTSRYLGSGLVADCCWGAFIAYCHKRVPVAWSLIRGFDLRHVRKCAVQLWTWIWIWICVLNIGKCAAK